MSSILCLSDKSEMHPGPSDRTEIHLGYSDKSGMPHSSSDKISIISISYKGGESCAYTGYSRQLEDV
jgi:hypothetical protein